MKDFKETSTGVLAGWVAKALVTFKCCADVTRIEQKITCSINRRITDFKISYHRNETSNGYETFWYIIEMNGITVESTAPDVIPDIEWWFKNFDEVLTMFLRFFRGQNLHQVTKFEQVNICDSYDENLEPEYYRLPWENISGVEVDDKGEIC